MFRRAPVTQTTGKNCAANTRRCSGVAVATGAHCEPPPIPLAATWWQRWAHRVFSRFVPPRDNGPHAWGRRTNVGVHVGSVGIRGGMGWHLRWLPGALAPLAGLAVRQPITQSRHGLRFEHCSRPPDRAVPAVSGYFEQFSAVSRPWITRCSALLATACQRINLKAMAGTAWDSAAIQDHPVGCMDNASTGGYPLGWWPVRSCVRSCVPFASAGAFVMIPLVVLYKV